MNFNISFAIRIFNFKKFNLLWKIIPLSSKIGDASFIGLECRSGNIDDCNDGPDEDLDGQFLENFWDPALILSEKESQCGSKCSFDPRLRSAPGKSKKWWTLWKSQAKERFSAYFESKSSISFTQKITHIKFKILKPTKS